MNRVILLFILGFLAFSCSRKVTSIKTPTKEREFDVKELEIDYFSLKSKIKLEEGDQSQNITALIRLRQDSIIWFNLSGTLGFQGMRGLFTADSVKILNRVDKEYVHSTYKELSEKINFKIDYKLVESIILGNLPDSLHDDDEPDKTENYYILRQNRYNLNITNYISPYTLKLEKVLIKEKNTSNHLNIEYAQFQRVTEHIFPFSCNISLFYESEDKILETLITIEHNKVEFPDKPLRFPFNVPNKYERD